MSATFTHETAVLKVRLAEDGWNSRDPEKVALAASPCALPTSGTMTPETGFARMPMKIGNLTTMVLCVCAWRISMIFQLENQSANIIGPWAGGRIITQG